MPGPLIAILHSAQRRPLTAINGKGEISAVLYLGKSSFFRTNWIFLTLLLSDHVFLGFAFTTARIRPVAKNQTVIKKDKI